MYSAQKHNIYVNKIWHIIYFIYMKKKNTKYLARATRNGKSCTSLWYENVFHNNL